MLQFLESGSALFVLAAVCGVGIVSRWATRNLYKRLIKETDNMTLTKNKNLRSFKQKTESTYRINQGIAHVPSYLERQMYDFRSGGMTLNGWNNFSNQMTLLCFLVGGAAAFGAYWYNIDPYYIVLYGSVGILTGLLTIFVDSGVNLTDKRQQLFVSLQNYMENSMFMRLSKEYSKEKEKEEVEKVEVKPLNERGDSRKHPTKVVVKKEEDEVGQALGKREIDSLKHSLEQIAASREKVREVSEDKQEDGWLKELEPEEMKLIGEIIREYLA